MTPRERYQADLDRPGFQSDPAQQRAVAALQVLYDELTAPPAAGLWSRLLNGRPAPVQGLYLWGGPGRGKTYLMDCFYDSLPFGEKRRVHFHRFMLEIHQALDGLPRTPNPLLIVAAGLADGCRVLCLDEFHVTDVADAMLLAGLLDALFDHRVTLVATSNIKPDDLYKDGLQRGRFLPAIELLDRHTRVEHLGGQLDFRLALLQQGGTYRVADRAVAAAWLKQHFLELAPVGPEYASSIMLHGREFATVAVAEDVVWFSFEELCLKPRSARDYLELARIFHTLLLESVPVFDEEMDEAARRFIHLIDALYDHGVKLIMAADISPESLYEGRRLEKTFQRTSSRLVEMSSEQYLGRPHCAD